MNSRLRKVTSPDRQGDVLATTDPEVAGKSGPGASAGGSTPVDALVSDFLKELNSIAVDLSPSRVKAAPPPPAVVIVPGPEPAARGCPPPSSPIVLGGGVPEPEPAAAALIPHLGPSMPASEDDARSGVDDAAAEIDAELARTLDELESVEKSTILTFPVPGSAPAQKVASADPSPPVLQEAPTELPVKEAPPQPRAGRQAAPAEFALAEFMNPRSQVKVSMTRWRGPRRFRRIAAFVIALVLLGIIAAAIYLLSTSAIGSPEIAPGVAAVPAAVISIPDAVIARLAFRG